MLLCEGGSDKLPPLKQKIVFYDHRAIFACRSATIFYCLIVIGMNIV